MLASTVQFSTYDQTPVTRPHQPRPTLGCRQRYEMQTGPDTRSPPTPRDHSPAMVRSLRTQQRAYDRSPTTTPRKGDDDQTLICSWISAGIQIRLQKSC